MNLKLEITRINEDVIATSSNLCEFYYKPHYYVTTCNDPTQGNEEEYSTYMYNSNSGEFVCIAPPIYNELAGVDSTGWYYYDGSSFVKCDENHDHPVK